ncbi:MAG TPA: hypothetical protein VMV47_16975 [Bacteroidales bacterium]|nr:hypothetical protein [Bacteroidales bacterium]
MKNLLKILSLLTIAGFILTSCEGPAGPEGPAGLDGTNGTNGVDGKDANETCKLCHNKDVVEAVAREYQYSVHFKGVAYAEEGTRNSCAPCHSSLGFLNVIEKSTPATFTGPDASGKYTSNYVAEAGVLALPGAIGCFTCHSSLHTDYEGTEFSPLATTAAVPLTMYGGTKTIDFDMENSNLCSKCHQPRPITGSNGNVIDYSLLVSDPTTAYALSKISFRTSVHYGTQSALAAGIGMGAIEFGTGYTNSSHVAGASCNTCHMATPSGEAGGHSFSAEGNFNGCNTTNCHTTMSSSNTTYKAAVADVETLLDDLLTAINAIGAGNDILYKDEDGNYSGYFNVYDPGSNPTGYWKSQNPSSSWTTAQKATNDAKPDLVITNAQFGAVINYSMVNHGAGTGVHNYPYIKTLLENSIAAI